MRQLAHSPLRYYLLTSLIVLLFGAVAPLTFAITGSQREESLRLSSLAASFDQSRADLYDLASSFDRYKATGRADLLSSYGAAKNDFERSLRALRLESRRLALRGVLSWRSFVRSVPCSRALAGSLAARR